MVTMDPKAFGAYVKSLRTASGLTLRQVEDRTKGRVKNAYLSQIENGAITLVSPGILWELAEVYDTPWQDLVERAGHRLPADAPRLAGHAIAGFPLRAIQDLDAEDRQLVVDYISFLRQRKRN